MMLNLGKKMGPERKIKAQGVNCFMKFTPGGPGKHAYVLFGLFSGFNFFRFFYIFIGLLKYK